MNGIYVGNNKMLIQTALGFRMYSFADDKSLTPDLVFHGVFEVPLSKYILRNIMPGNTVIDVGANIGYFTMLLASKVGWDGKVIAYEASKKNYEMLMENASFNGIGPRSDIRNKAVYKEKGELTFYTSHKWTGNGSLLQHDEEYFKVFQTDTIIEEKIEAESLDMYADEPFIDFIKMDIEGGEMEAFMGMKTLFEQRKIGKIVFELNKLRMEERYKQFHDLLVDYQEKYALKFFHLNNDGIPVPTTLDELFKYNFVESVLLECN